MNDTKASLASLALDLNRVAIGLHRGSNFMAQRFFQEALSRKSEINTKGIPNYIKNILSKLNKKQTLNEQFAEETLVYSILIENFIVKIGVP